MAAPQRSTSSHFKCTEQDSLEKTSLCYSLHQAACLLFLHHDLEGDFKHGFSDSKSQREGKQQPGDLPEASKGCFSPERPVWLVVNNTDLGQTSFVLLLILGPICILRTNSPHTDCSHKPHLLYCREAAMRKCLIHLIRPTTSVHY